MQDPNFTDQSGSFKIKGFFTPDGKKKTGFPQIQNYQPTFVIQNKQILESSAASPSDTQEINQKDLDPQTEKIQLLESDIAKSEEEIEVTECNIDENQLLIETPSVPVKSSLMQKLMIWSLAIVFIVLFINGIQQRQMKLKKHVAEVKPVSSTAVQLAPHTDTIQIKEELVESSKVPVIQPQDAETVYLPPLTTPSSFYAFLDLKTNSLPAKIYYGDKFLGMAPFQKNIVLEPQESYELRAEYQLDDVKDVLKQTVSFQVNPDNHFASAIASADVGILSVQNIPAQTDIFIDGKYSNDAKIVLPETITNVTFGKPIYLPFGEYKIQLKEKSTAKTLFENTYQVDASNSFINLQIADQDLVTYTLQLASEPAGASLLLDGKMLGFTPFVGKLPLGSHELKLSKEGFLDASIVSNNPVSTINKQVVTLAPKTAQTLLTFAKEQIAKSQNEEAIKTLNEALQLQPTEKDQAEAQYLLGTLALLKADFKQAKSFFETARKQSDFYAFSSLGLVDTYDRMKNHKGAFQVLLNLLSEMGGQLPEDMKTKASALFKKLSPDRSVIYITTNPESADVIVNDQLFKQTSPFILSDLKAGDYQLVLKKAGYSVFEGKKTLPAGEFVPVKVDLQPITAAADTP